MGGGGRESVVFVAGEVGDGRGQGGTTRRVSCHGDSTKFYRAFTGAPPISCADGGSGINAHSRGIVRVTPPRYPIGRAQFREIRVTYFSFHGAIRRVTNGGIFMAHPRPFSGAPATPPLAILPLTKLWQLTSDNPFVAIIYGSP